MAGVPRSWELSNVGPPGFVPGGPGQFPVLDALHFANPGVGIEFGYGENKPVWLQGIPITGKIRLRFAKFGVATEPLSP